MRDTFKSECLPFWLEICCWKILKKLLISHNSTHLEHDICQSVWLRANAADFWIRIEMEQRYYQSFRR